MLYLYVFHLSCISGRMHDVRFCLLTHESLKRKKNWRTLKKKWSKFVFSIPGWRGWWLVEVGWRASPQKHGKKAKWSYFYSYFVLLFLNSNGGSNIGYLGHFCFIYICIKEKRFQIWQLNWVVNSHVLGLIFIKIRHFHRKMPSNKVIFK